MTKEQNEDMLKAMQLLKDYCRSCYGCTACPMCRNCQRKATEDFYPYKWTIPTGGTNESNTQN